MRFKDLKIKKHSMCSYKDIFAIQCRVDFPNGEWCSIVGGDEGSGLYGNCVTSFEIMSSSTEKTRAGVKGWLSKRQVMNHLRYLRNKRLFKVGDLVKHDDYVGVVEKVYSKKAKYDYGVYIAPFGFHKLWEEDLIADDGED